MSQRAKSSNTGKHRPQPDAQRESLKRSEKSADEKQPENFKDVETAEKVVEIGPDLEDAPIKGLDPSKQPRPRGVEASS